MATITDPSQPAGSAKIGAGRALFVDTAGGLDRFELLKSSDYWKAAAQGLIPGASVVEKYGRLPAIGTGSGILSVWPGTVGATYPFQSGTFTIEGFSGAAADSDALNTGMEQVTVEGLDTNWVAQTSTFLTNGVGVVAIPGTWRRVFRAYGTLGVTNLGDITIRITGAGAVQAIIEADYGQTYQAIYTVPLGKTAQLLKWGANITDSNITSFGETALFARLEGLPFRARDTNPCSTTSVPRETQGSVILPEKTDIDLRIMSVSANSLAIVGGFDLGLLDVA